MFGTFLDFWEIFRLWLCFISGDKNWPSWKDDARDQDNVSNKDKDNPTDIWDNGGKFWQLRTSIHDNFCYPTIKSDTGQQSQFLQCLNLNS